VAFHATGLQSHSPQSGTPLVFNKVVLNEGGSYDSATGYFTVSVPGLYVFVTSTGPLSSNMWVSFYLYVDDAHIDRSWAYNQDGKEMSSVHGVVHLQAGQKVWVRSNGEQLYWDQVSAFTGFLLSPDL
jgi:hypothetical protein